MFPLVKILEEFELHFSLLYPQWGLNQAPEP